MDTITTFLNIRIDYGFKKDLFDASDTHNMVNEEVVAYSQSLQKLRATQAGIRYASQQALEKGREEGRVEGMEMGLRRVMVNMLSMGAPMDTIVQAAGLSRTRVEELPEEGNV